MLGAARWSTRQRWRSTRRQRPAAVRAGALPRSTSRSTRSLDIGLTWVRRTRVGGALREGTGTVPLAEDSDACELDFLDPDGAVVRTVATDPPSYTYTVAEQDFPVTNVRVCQLSAQVGRRFVAELTFDNAPVYASAGEVIAEGQGGNPAADFEAGA